MNESMIIIDEGFEIKVDPIHPRDMVRWVEAVNHLRNTMEKTALKRPFIDIKITIKKNTL